MKKNRMKWLTVFLVLMFWAMCGSTLSAQQEVNPEPSDKVAQPEPDKSKNIAIDFKEADIQNVLKIISYKSGVNIVSTPDVVGNITLRLVDVPWETALDVLLKTYGFGYQWLNDKVIMVLTLDKLTQQKKAQDEAVSDKLTQQKKAQDEAAAKEPLDTQVFILNFSRADSIEASIGKLISERGKITVELRTNSLIITDTKSRLSVISGVIKNLDRKTPQVMIEAKIIETTLGSAEKLGINWSLQVALSGSKRPITFPFTSYVKGTGSKMFPKTSVPSELQQVETAETGASGDTVNSYEERTWHQLVPGFPDVPTDLFTFGMLDFTQLQAVLEILNQRTDTKILSNPRITTLVNKEANIFVGDTVPIPTYEYSKESGTRVVSGYETQKIGIGLTVIPNVNEQDYITLTLRPTVDQITGFTGPNNERPIVSTRQAETNVMVKDGQTLVIGGLISEKKIKYKKKIPLLGDIPLLGRLFSKKEDTVNKTDLLIFITPHIIKDKDFKTEGDMAQIGNWFDKDKAINYELSQFEKNLAQDKVAEKKEKIEAVP